MIESDADPREDFDKARDEIKFNEKLLSRPQRIYYDKFTYRQKKTLDKQIAKAEKAEKDYLYSKKENPEVVLNLQPPFNVKDPYVKQLAARARAEVQKVEDLKKKQFIDKKNLLNKMRSARETSKVKTEFNQKSRASTQTKSINNDFNKQAGKDNKNLKSVSSEKQNTENKLSQKINRAEQLKQSELEKDLHEQFKEHSRGR